MTSHSDKVNPWARWSVSEAGKWGGILKLKPAAWRYVPSQAKVVM